jgi:RHS repeat-associated protein
VKTAPGGQLHAHLATADTFSQPLRMPGQFHDEESGLHYTTFRYYDPHAGRFISPDPIGLVGGMNLYQYAPNPIAWIDPLGLMCGPNAAQRRDIESLRSGKDVSVKSAEEARALLSHMPDLRPHVDKFPANSGEIYRGTPFSNLWKQPNGTYRGDLYNIKDPLSDVIHDSGNFLHDTSPHYNIMIGDGTKAVILMMP